MTVRKRTMSSRPTREHELEALIVDLCDDSMQWYEIQESYGVSEDRAKEMVGIITRVFDSYYARMDVVKHRRNRDGNQKVRNEF